MLLRIIAIGSKMTAWVQAGFQDYAKRFPPFCKLELCEIPAEKRSKNSDLTKIVQIEGQKILAAIKPGNKIIALERTGKSWSTDQLADQLAEWQQQGQNIDFIIGGPEGLSAECLLKADLKFSLSALTLPHPLVRIILAEQLYRALSILQKHPYHR